MKNEHRQLKFIAEHEGTYDPDKMQHGQREPMKIYTKESLIEELRKVRDMGWIPSARHGISG